jgi:NADP-dependent 3-hydroxy acid dehydrogenase YdfG
MLLPRLRPKGVPGCCLVGARSAILPVLLRADEKERPVGPDGCRADFPTPWEPVYASSKWAINRLVQTARRQVFKYGIGVGSISP